MKVLVIAKKKGHLRPVYRKDIKKPESHSGHDDEVFWNQVGQHLRVGVALEGSCPPHLPTVEIRTRPWTLDKHAVDEVFSGLYTKHVRLRQGDVVVDVGAHIGSFTLYAAGAASKVYAFEPHPDNFRILQENVELNHLDNVELVNAAVLDYDGETRMPRTFPLGNTGGLAVGSGELEVRAVTLDSVVPEANFVKVDAEGAEMKILRGSPTLLESGPNLAMEVHGGFGKTHEVAEFLEQLGYRTMQERNLLNHTVWASKEGLVMPLR